MAKEVGGSRGRGKKAKQKPQQAGTKKNAENGTQQRLSSPKISKSKNKSNKNGEAYVRHMPLDECIEIYSTNTDGSFIRGKIRVLPFSPSSAPTSTAFVTCDRGLHAQDICIPSQLDRNRAMDGDIVYVRVVPPGLDDESGDQEAKSDVGHLVAGEGGVDLSAFTKEESEGEDTLEDASVGQDREMWQDDEDQMKLWNPQVSIRKPAKRRLPTAENNNRLLLKEQRILEQPRGVVVCIVPPKAVESEIDPSKPNTCPSRRVVGTLKILNGGAIILLTPNNHSMPQFRCPSSTKDIVKKLIDEHSSKDAQGEEEDPVLTTYFQAQYEYGSWQESFKWPPCTRLQKIGSACVLEDEVQALLSGFDVDHGDFPPQVLRDVEASVKSGLYYYEDSVSGETVQGWKPTPNMRKGRRDFRSERIFTIDPTTAKDLDDALHIKELDDGTIEVGVHIADVSYFVRPEEPVDLEARKRTTTVYLVDRTVPMLPRALCEIACSLNENVERLAFSCVWKMNPDGTMARGVKDPVWYGRSVIRSCARLDYATAQNIIEGSVANGERELSDELWPPSRRPSGSHTIDQVASDVRLMHRVAMARRRLRFENGALVINSIKLTFLMDTDGQTPLLSAPYPIRDSNRLVEEYMLLANYLVAERLIMFAKDRAVLRCHKEPDMDQLDALSSVVMSATGHELDVSTSKTLHASLVEIGRAFSSQPLIMQCVTEMLKTPLVPAEYFPTGSEIDRELWRHYALNIPYYTHFTSPIRRYPDVLVHRLLQATLDGNNAIDDFGLSVEQLDDICDHCNDKRLDAKKAQERCDVVFLSLYVKANPLEDQLGVVLSVGESAFSVFVPHLGFRIMCFVKEHETMVTSAVDKARDGSRRILLQRRMADDGRPCEGEMLWSTLEIAIMVKLRVNVICKTLPPIDVKLRLVGPWED